MPDNTFAILHRPYRSALVSYFIEDSNDTHAYMTFFTDNQEGEEKSIAVRITSIEKEDGSGHCFNIRGIDLFGKQVKGFVRTNEKGSFFNGRVTWGTLIVE